MRYGDNGKKLISDEDYKHLIDKLRIEEFTQEQIDNLMKKIEELEIMEIK